MIQGSDNKKKSVKVPISTAPRWIPPLLGSFKFDTDAALGKTVGKTTVAVIARHQDGSYLGASSPVIEGIMDPEVMEAITVREALALVEDIGCMTIHVASNCLRAINNQHDENKTIYAQTFFFEMG